MMADIQDDTNSSLEDEVTAPTTTTDDSNDTLLTLSFNQDGGCLAIGTARGFRICNVSPFQETFRRTFDHDGSVSGGGGGGGGIGCVEMLFRCNLLALVGGGTSPQYPTNKVLIWDDHIARPIGELSFRQRVLAVRLRRDRICVAMRDRVYVYNFGDLALLDTIITGGEANGLGLLCISTDAGDAGDIIGEPSSSLSNEEDGMVLACPSVQRGQVRVELYGMRKNVLIDAHEGSLAAMALSVDGSLLATASERGTIIRLFETGKKAKDSSFASGIGSMGGDASSSSSSSPHPPGTPLREFRRGVEHAKIGCLSFSLDKSWLACVSDRETVHIFQIHRNDRPQASSSSATKPPSSPSRSKSTFSYASRYAKKILPSMLTKSPKKYLQGEQSFVQVRGGITHPRACAFVPDQPYTIAVAGLDDYGNGCTMLATFGEECKSSSGSSQQRPVKGEAKRLSFHRFFKKSMDKQDRSKKHTTNDFTGGNDEIVCSDETDQDEDRVNDLTKEVGDVNVGGEDNAVEVEEEETKDGDANTDEPDSESQVEQTKTADHEIEEAAPTSTKD